MKKIYRTALIFLSCVASVCAASCGQIAHEHAWKDGKCETCGEICVHSWDRNTVCENCGIALECTVRKLPCSSVNGNIYGMLYLPDRYYGRLKTVIVSHGFGVNCSGAMASYLTKRGYACYIFDFCGGSPVTRSDMDFRDMTILTEKNDLLAVYRAVAGLPFVDRDEIYLYGESQGGLVTAIAAVDLIDEIAGIILMYPGFSIVSAMAEQYADATEIPPQTEVGGHLLNRTYAEAVFRFLPHNFEKPCGDGEELLRQRLAVTRYLYEYVAQYGGETLIFHGTEDRVVDIAFSREAIKYYPSARLIEVQGQDHPFDMTNFGIAARRIDLFINGRSVV